ncbi:MAG: NAD-dependent epimerase/dehydratase family protein [Haloferacaceae archaeon]
MSTLITGGAGLIGSAIVERLHERGETAVRFDLEGKQPSDTDVPFYAGDVRNYDALADAIEEHDPDRLVHLAAIIGSRTNEIPTEALQVNAVGTDNVFRAAKAYDIDRVAWTSTLGVYGPASSYPTDAVSEETVTPAAYNVYPASSFYRAMKQLNEYQSRMYAAEHGVDTRAVRPSVVFGPERDRGWLGRFIDDAIETGESTIERPPDAALPLVYMTDVAELIVAVLLAEEPAHQVYNTGANTVTARELADVVEQETGGTVHCNPDAPPKASPAEIGNDRAVEEFDYSLLSMADAVRDYIERIS